MSLLKISSTALLRWFPILRPVQNRKFNLLIIYEILFFSAIWIVSMLFSLLTTKLKGNSPLYVGLVGFAFNAPMWLAPFSGIFIDKMQRKKILGITAVTALVFSVLIALLIIFFTVHFLQLFVLVFFIGICMATMWSALFIAIYDVLPETEILGNGISIANFINRFSQVFGGAVLGTLLLYYDNAVASLSAVLCFMFSIIVLHQYKHTVILHPSDQSLWDDFKAGISFIKQSVPVMAVLAILIIAGTFAWPYLFQLAVINQYYLHGTPSSLGWLNLVAGIGGSLGGLVIGMRRNHFYLLRIMMASVLLLACALFGLSIARTVWAGEIAVFCIDFMLVILMTVSIIFIQILTPEELQGRIMGIITWCSFGFIPIGSLLFYGLVGEVIGILPTFMMGSAVLIFTWLLLLSFSRKIRLIALTTYRMKNKEYRGQVFL